MFYKIIRMGPHAEMMNTFIPRKESRALSTMLFEAKLTVCKPGRRPHWEWNL